MPASGPRPARHGRGPGRRLGRVPPRTDHSAV